MYQFEKVTYDEGLTFAKEINAIYKRVSNKGDKDSINELFRSIGRKFLNPEYDFNYCLNKALNNALNKYLNY